MNLACKFYLQNHYLYVDEPWSGILRDTAFVVQRMYHTMMQYMPGHMVFGRDMVLNTPFISDWEDMRRRKKKIIDKITRLKTKPVNLTHI